LNAKKRAGLKDLLKKLRKYEIQIRKAINSQMMGDFHSIFKGSGLEFDDVRPYQYGDDIRIIDWNVSAKGHGTFVKTFREEKEQTIYFILDVSASQTIGAEGRTKLDMGKEICGVLALAGAKESSQVGLICFSNEREAFVKPAKGLSQAYQIIHRLVHLRPASGQTNLRKALAFSLNAIRRRSVIIMISDFVDEGFYPNLKSLARKHDVVVIQINDLRETSMPKMGIVPARDKESGQTIWINTSFGDFRERIVAHHGKRVQDLSVFCKKHQINYLRMETHQDYVPQLLRLFKVRNKSLKSA
jgi:uncharacterized protein (DUF58 family)